MGSKTITYTTDQLSCVVSILMDMMQSYRIIVLKGPLGSGKTTLIRSFLRACGIEQSIQSPTFSYVQTYINHAGYIFHHFDLYRIDSLQQFQQAGFDEYLYKQQYSWVLIEWPEVIESLLKEDVCEVSLAYNCMDENIRVATLYTR